MNDTETFYKNELIPRFFKKAGEHCLIAGQTGSGKTQVMYHLLDYLLTFHPKETVIWFDTGKSNEILILETLGDENKRELKFFIPKGRDVTIEGRDSLDKYYFEPKHPRTIFKNLDKNKINVICLDMFFMEDPSEYTEAINKIFFWLIKLAMDFNLQIPLAIFIDEIHSIAPSDKAGFNEAHHRAAVRFERNVERLRSMKVRIIGSVQNWTKVRRGVRTSFPWIVIKRGVSFPDKDVPMLAKYNDKWHRLASEECVFVRPTRSFFDKYIQTKFYGDGFNAGKVHYIEPVEEEEEIPIAQPTSSYQPLAHDPLSL